MQNKEVLCAYYFCHAEFSHTLFLGINHKSIHVSTILMTVFSSSNLNLQETAHINRPLGALFMDLPQVSRECVVTESKLMGRNPRKLWFTISFSLIFMTPYFCSSQKHGQNGDHWFASYQHQAVEMGSTFI